LALRNRLTAAILAALLICSGSQLYSCASDNESAETISETTVPATEEETTAFADKLPEGLDLEGKTVTFLSRLYERYQNELSVDGLTGDVVNDAVYNRLIAVQDRLNVKIDNHKEMGTNAAHGALEIITKSILAGEDEYNVYVGSMYNSTASSADGYWMNLYDVQYLDPSQPYWSSYYIQKASIGNKLYTITGDLAISMIRLLGVTFFNKSTIADYGIGDLYSKVNDGTWTIEYELGIIKDIYKDINGNGERDKDDLYGLGTSDTFSVDAYTSSFDLEILAKDENNYPYINVNLDKAQSILETVYNLCYNTTGVNTYHFDTDDSEMTEIAKVFSENRFVLMSNWIYSTETSFLRNMESDYGIIPYPKFNEDQPDYYSYANDQFSVFVIPRTVVDTASVGAVLEALCSSSRDTVIAAYYETALKDKYARDSESGKMLDLIVKNFKLDPAWMYSSVLNGISQQLLRTQIWNKSDNVASTYAKMQKSFENALKLLNKKFQKLEDQNNNG
jgi:hypothetical protein